MRVWLKGCPQCCLEVGMKMETNTLVGAILILVSLSDVVLGLLVIGPRVDPEKRKVVQGVFLGGSLITLLAGFAFLARLIVLP